jgi:hypothetical protein
MTETPDENAGEWISITDAAARLTEAGDPVDRSTLSRYLTQYAEALPTRREGRSNLVEFSALMAHRGDNIRRRSRPAVTAASVPGRNAAQHRQPGRFAGTQSDGMARKINADAELREMDLAERRGELTPTSEVDQAGRDAIALMQAAFDRGVETEAATLSVRYGWDERLTRIALKQFAKRGLEVFNREIRERLDAERRSEFAAEEGEEGRPSSGAPLQ